MRRSLAALLALLLAAGLAGPALAHVHGGDETPGLAARDAGPPAGGARAGEACALCTMRAPVRQLGPPGAAATLAAARARGACAPAPLLRAPRSPLRDAAPARAPPQRG